MTADFGTIAVGGSATITIVVNVTVSYGNLVNTATATSTTPDPDPDNNHDTAVTTVGSGIPMLSPELMGLLALDARRRRTLVRPPATSRPGGASSDPSTKLRETGPAPTRLARMFSSADAKFVVLAFSSLFSVINPIEAAPIFVSLTAGMPGERRRMALRASTRGGADPRDLRADGRRDLLGVRHHAARRSRSPAESSSRSWG